MKKSKKVKIKKEVWFIVFTFFSFAILFARATYIAVVPEPKGITNPGVTLKDFSAVRTKRIEKLPTSRGTIYDANGKVLAQNVSSYTLIANLNENKTTNKNKPLHVVDIDLTAEKLSTVLDIEEEQIKYYLEARKRNNNISQVEFGSKGRGLSEIVKDEILALGLPGLDFTETKKRYYPNGDFLSYTLGYAKNQADNSIKGEMGLELEFDDILTGSDGSIEYQKDNRGYKIANTKEIRIDPVLGHDIYLTVNNNIQFFVDQAIKNSLKNYTFEKMDIIVADAKTGAILAMSNYPSFNPNIKNITNYLNPNISIPIEPGSTQKIFTYMATMEDGSYVGSNTFLSGTYLTKDNTEIGDHDRRGWGRISFDTGFAYSSNVGSLHLVKDYINANKLRDYFKRVGFGSKTNIELPRESSGKIDFKYETEVYTASFGQGITTTPIQNIKALTSITNNGVLLQPYIIKKIVDPNKNEVILENDKIELEKVASKDTVTKIKSLMKDVMTEMTGTPFNIPGYDFIGKTGTAQIAKTDGSGYMEGKANVIRSFSGIYPGDDPELIIYGTVTTSELVAPLSNAIKEIIINSSNYLNIKTDVKEELDTVTNYKVESFINKNLDSVLKTLNKSKINPIVLGDGSKIINQYPSIGTNVSNLDKVILITNSNDYLMPDINNWSRKDVEALCRLLKLNLKIENEGYVFEQSILPNEKINKKDTLKVKLKY